MHVFKEVTADDSVESLHVQMTWCIEFALPLIKRLLYRRFYRGLSIVIIIIIITKMGIRIIELLAYRPTSSDRLIANSEFLVFNNSDTRFLILDIQVGKPEHLS